MDIKEYCEDASSVLDNHNKISIILIWVVSFSGGGSSIHKNETMKHNKVESNEILVFACIFSLPYAKAFSKNTNE